MKKQNELTENEISVVEKTEEAVEEVKVAATPAEEPKQEGPKAYVGPTIQGIATQYTVYAGGGISESLQEAINEAPIFGSLVVPLEQLSEAMTSINNKQGAFYIQYLKALDHKRKEI